MTETPARSFLDNLFAQARDLATRGEAAAAAVLGVGEDPESRASMRKTALAAGVAGLVLGTRSGRRLARRGLALGGLGLIGKVAWDAVQGRQAGPPPDAAPAGELTGESGEERAQLIAFAIISAAKADGHIDAQERARIDAALVGLPANVRDEMEAALLRAPDPLEVARLARSGQERREVYAASFAAAGRDHPSEVAYLDRLAEALGLDSREVAAIEAGLPET